LTAKFKLCFSTTQKTKQLKQAKMWGEYHQLRTSSSFSKEWENFLEKSMTEKQSVAFYQYVSHEVFKELIKLQHPLNATSTSDDIPPLSHDEKNAVHYVAGYVCRKVHEHLKQSDSPGKEAMMLCLSDMNGGDIDEENHTDAWLRTINRGGLWQVTNEVYQLFYNMEIQMKKKLPRGADGLSIGSRRADIIEDLLKNEDLLFQWCFCASDLPSELDMTLLKLLVELFMTVHGHGYTTSSLELYKQETKKKKALRTVLNKSTE